MSKHFSVSDHALVRYIERILKMDLTPVRAEIASKCEDGAKAGARRIVCEGATFEIRQTPTEAVVATVMTREMLAENRREHHLRNKHRGVGNACVE
jgi:cation transport regulator ChaC